MRKIAILLAIFAVLVPAVLAAALRTPEVRRRLRELAVQAIRDELGLRADIADLDVEYAPFALRTGAVSLDHPVHGRIVQAESLSIRPSLIALLGGKVDLESIEIARPKVRLVVREGKIVNLPDLEDTSDSGSTTELPFRDLSLSDAALDIDGGELFHLKLEGVDLDLEASRGPSIELRAIAAEGSLDHQRGHELIRRFEARARISPDSLQVYHLLIDSPHLRVAAREARVALPDASRYHGKVDVELDTAHLARLPLELELPPIEGRVSISAEVQGGGSARPTGHGTVAVRAGKIDVYGLGDVDLRFTLERELVRIDQGQARLIEGGGSVGIRGTLGLGEGLPLEAHLDITDLSFARLMKQLDVSPNAIIEWILSGTIDLGGTIDPLNLEGPIRTVTRDLLVTRGPWHEEPRRPVIGVEHAPIHGIVSVRPDALRFERLIAELPHTRVRGDVMLGFDNDIYVGTSSEHLDLADATPLLDFELAGAGPVTVEVTGTFQEVDVRGSVAFRDFAFATFPLGNLESDWRLEKDSHAVRFPRITAQKHDSRYVVDDLFMDFSDQRFLMTGKIEAQPLTLADLYHAFHFETDERFEPFQGVLRGRGDVRYTMDFPGDSPTGTLVVGMDVTIPEANFNGYAFTDGEFLGEWRWLNYPQGYRGGEVDVDRLALRKGDGTLVVSGKMGLGGTLDMLAVADRFSVQETEGLGDRMPSLSGTYGAVAHIGGTAEVMRVNGDLQMTGLAWAGIHLGDARLYMRMTDTLDPWVREAATWESPEGHPCGHARMGFATGKPWAPDPPLRTRDGMEPSLVRPMAFLVCGEGLGGRARLDMAFGRTKVYPLRGSVMLDGFDLGQFLPGAGTEDALAGTVSASVELRDGAMLADNSLIGDVRISELRVSQDRVELRNDGEIAVALDRGGFDVTRAELRGPSSRISVAGGGSLVGGLATRIDGEIDLALLASLSTTVSHAEGRVAVHLGLTGPIGDPSVFGEAVISDGAFQLASFPQPITGLEGRVTFSEQQMLFEDLRAEVAGGELGIRGSASMRGTRLDRFEFDIESRDLVLAPVDGVDVAFGTDLRLTWRDGDRLPRLGGLLALNRVVYTRPVGLGASLQLGEITREQRTEVQQYDPARDHVELDVRVVQNGPIRVNNDLIDADIQIEDGERPLRILGTDQRFGVDGALGVSRGRIRFRNADFEVRRGSVELDGGSDLNPRFDILAVTEVRREARRSEGSSDLSSSGWRIALHAHGDAHAFRLDMSSDPDLSQEDIAFLLTLGMTRTELDQLQTSEVTSAIALEALTVVTGVDREVERMVPLEFGVTSGYSTVTGRTEPQVSIGKRLAEGVRLSATQALSNTTEFRTNLEWRLSNQTRVQASYDNVNTTSASSIGNFGVDLRWSLEFE